MGKVVFVVGGNRSGKSKFAQEYAESIKGKRIYLATAIAFDEEMKSRIEKHVRDREGKWDSTIEEPVNVEDVLSSLNGKADVVLFDCITLWLNNLLMKYDNNQNLIYNKIENLKSVIENVHYNLFIVSNEVGMGIIPENKLARFFRDLSGHTNQLIAKVANEFYVSFCGYTLRLK